jgi:diguanylate cyclase (GGDEF)-like protein
MNLLSLPDIAGMVILMGVLDWLRRKYRDSSVDLWMLGLLFVLLEAVSVAVLKNLPSLSRMSHAMALDAYVLAGVTFGWAARQDLIPGQRHLPLFVLPAVPLFALTTIYGWDVKAPAVYITIVVASLLAGSGYAARYIRGSARFRAKLVAISVIFWTPMIWMAATGRLRLLVYWGLACLYLLVAVSFRNRIKPGGIGGLVIVTGFTVWALCFLAHPFVRGIPFYYDLDEQLWTMQKFFVIVGMLLVLLEDQTRRLEEDAMHDPLTGLPNRRLFDDRLLQALSRARRTGLSAAVFVVDLDNFKQINDTHGHRTGDLVLARAGQVLKTKIRSSDTLARCGGDEFSVIVNDLARPGDCERIAEALRSAVESVELPAGTRGRLSGSVGYALYPDDVSEATELCELADVRMYKDKRASRSTGVAGLVSSKMVS